MMSAAHPKSHQIPSTPPLRRLWVPVFMMAGISVLSGSAGVQMGSLSFVGIDKLGHLVVFGLLGVAWARCWPVPDSRRLAVLLAAVLLTSGFGLLDELHQYRNPERTFEWADWLADTVGAVSGAALYLYCRPLQALSEIKLRDVSRLRRRRSSPGLGA
jgi:VanZ family protein